MPSSRQLLSLRIIPASPHSQRQIKLTFREIFGVPRSLRIPSEEMIQHYTSTRAPVELSRPTQGIVCESHQFRRIDEQAHGHVRKRPRIGRRHAQSCLTVHDGVTKPRYIVSDCGGSHCICLEHCEPPPF